MQRPRTSTTRRLLSGSQGSAALSIPGTPTGAPAWRGRVADHATAHAADLRLGHVLGLAFVLPPRRWVDLDTLVESTVAGLRDAGGVAPRLAGVNGIIATKAFGAEPGARIQVLPVEALMAPTPGPAALTVATDAVPAARRESKRMWRDSLDRRWGGRDVLTGAVWADVALAATGSLLGPLEVVLDALEPVLGRDPRGRPWQEFFPNDHRIEWLRVRRDATGPALALQLGPMPS